MAAAAVLDDTAEDGEVLENVAEHSQNVMLTFTYDAGMSKVLHVQDSATTHIRSLTRQHPTPAGLCRIRIRAPRVVFA